MHPPPVDPRSFDETSSARADKPVEQEEGLEDGLDYDPPPLPLLNRLMSLIFILVPLAALPVAAVLFWGWGCSLVDVCLLLGMYILTGLGVTIGYHRFFTHRSFDTSRVMQAILAVLGSMAIEGPVLQWVATHRSHHQHSDLDDDPHSPHTHGAGMLNMLRGAFRAHVGWILEPNARGLRRYVVDYKADRLIQWISRLFPLWVLASLLIPALLGGLITLSWTGALLGFLWGGLVRIFVVHHITWSINSVCHIWGTRPFKSHDHSRNNLIFGVLAFGEGWHNNHHAFPTSARHGLRWWQVDVSYAIIRVMSWMRLVWNVRTPSQERMIAKLR